MQWVADIMLSLAHHVWVEASEPPDGKPRARLLHCRLTLAVAQHWEPNKRERQKAREQLRQLPIGGRCSYLNMYLRMA